LRFSLRTLFLVVAVLAVCLLAINKAVRVPNDRARAEIRSILHSNATSHEQLAALKPYVKIGDHISVVNKRIAPRPDVPMDVDRPTYHSYGLGTANLELAIRSDGIVLGIGRHVYDRDDGETWLHPPKW
jgi:hypothetical protein